MSDGIKNDGIKSTGSSYPTAGFLEELGAATAETICKNLRAANDDAPSFGPSPSQSDLPHFITHSRSLDAEKLADALVQLRAFSKRPELKVVKKE